MLLHLDDDRSRKRSTGGSLPETLLSSALDASASGVLIAECGDSGIRIVFANRTLAERTGHSREELLGRDFAVFCGPRTIRSTIERLDDAARCGRSHREMLLAYSRDGTPFWADFTLSPAHGSEQAGGHMVATLDPVDHKQRAERTGDALPFHDGLTGLLNRPALEREIDYFLSRGLPPGSLPVLLLLDIDHLGAINHIMGHAAGDRVLWEFSSQLDSIFQGDAIIARIGGDEFGVFLPALEEASQVFGYIDRILKLFDTPYTPRPGHRTFLTASIGVSALDRPADRASLLLQQAALAQSHAKDSVRNSYFVFEEELDRRSRDRAALRLDLCNALERAEMELHFQPQVNARTRSICGLEALLRWNHPELGLLGPDVFIPVAEETGLIIELGAFALREACRYNHSLIERRLLDVPVAVNISQTQLVRESFFNEVMEALEETGLAADRLELEVTESMVMDTMSRARAQLGSLKEQGVRIAIDDFGTGYSNLGYLKMEPVRTLKIDKTFIHEVTRQSSDAGIVRAIIAMAHNLDMSVVAEGVETESQASFLQRNRCDVLQGFYFNKPLTCRDLENHLHDVQRGQAGESAATEGKRTLLLVDDERNILRALARTLRSTEYRILQATSGDEALDLLAREEVHVIISDQRMPEMTGIELLRRVKDIYPDIVRIILSGYTELATVTNAINRGSIYRFLTKPWQEKELREHVEEAFRHFDANTAGREQGAGRDNAGQ